MQSAAARLVACGPTGARAIDILVASMTKVLAEPHKERYRIVDPSHPAMRPVAEARGGTEFLWAIGYEPLCRPPHRVRTQRAHANEHARCSQALPNSSFRGIVARGSRSSTPLPL